MPRLTMALALRASILVGISAANQVGAQEAVAKLPFPTQYVSVYQEDLSSPRIQIFSYFNPSVQPLPTGVLTIRGAGGWCQLPYPYGSECSFDATVKGLDIPLLAHYGGDDNYEAADVPLTAELLQPLDINGDGTVDSADALLVTRFLMGVRGPALTESAVPSGSKRSPAGVVNYLVQKKTVLDIDDSGISSALGDGLLIHRYIAGMRGEPLVSGIVGRGALRTTPDSIESYLESLSSPMVANPRISLGTFPSQYGVSSVVRVFATVSGDAAIPTGSIAVGGTIGDCTINLVEGSGSCDIAVQPTAMPKIVGDYSGDANYPPASQSISMRPYTVQGVSPNYCQGSSYVYDVRDWPDGNVFTLDIPVEWSVPGAVRFWVPLDPYMLAEEGRAGYFRVTAAPGSAEIQREVSISTRACDFQTQDIIASSIGAGQTSAYFPFTIERPRDFVSAGALFDLRPGTLIWVSVRNVADGMPTCPLGVSCPVTVELGAPNRP